MRVLLVEDDPSTAKSIELMLNHAGLNVYTTDLGEEACDLVALYDYDIVLLNINLPDMNGFDVLSKIRTKQIVTPVMVVSGEDSTDSKVRGLNLGADDYVTKPFHRQELIARIHAIIRRSKGHAESTIRFGSVELNIESKKVYVGDVQIHFTGKEYQILELLCLRMGQTLTKEIFLNHLYGGMDEPELKIVDVFMSKIRKKLEGATGERIIETVWGQGYVIERRNNKEIPNHQRKC